MGRIEPDSFQNITLKWPLAQFLIEFLFPYETLQAGPLLSAFMVGLHIQITFIILGFIIILRVWIYNSKSSIPLFLYTMWHRETIFSMIKKLKALPLES